MFHPIVALVGPSKSGKTTLTLEALDQTRSTIKIVTSVTTRAYREAADGRFYEIISRRAFARLHDQGSLIQFGEDDNELYGNVRETTEKLLRSSTGIMALTEDGVRNFRSKGYRVIVVRVTPLNGIVTTNAEHLAQNQERSLLPLHPDLVIMNGFGKGGKALAVMQLKKFLDTVS
ncbi:MAG: hypothetical protein NUV56_00030 [Candidatus Uhrbacteria bacterium]|nr:hypothetical protein [Candidatus Uhrbacteria bacterium]